MNRHALEVLQYPEALQLVAGFASSPMGAEAVRALEPSDASGWIAEELERVEQMGVLVQRTADWSMPDLPDCRQPLRRLATPGGVLEPLALRDLARLMAAAHNTRAVLRSRTDVPLITQIAERLGDLEDAEEQVRHAIDDAGDVRDHASRELARLRREIKGSRGRVVQRLEQYMASLPSRVQVADASVTQREGRYVIPIRREGRGNVGGLVHDESATGQTLFVEPPIAIELMNQLRELEIAEAREVQRILRELSDALRPQREALETSLGALVELDSLWARARFALRYDGHRPQLLPRGTSAYEVVNGRHPILLAAGGAVVPFDLALDPGERTLLVSGPNTGGKTVLLKAIGLSSALAQAGIIPTVGESTRLPVFDDAFADIGDEQSIEASLSTFSAHLRNLREILERARSASLVLINEMGSGTDPAEGGALSRAILIELTRRGALTVATTHLGELKLLAAEEGGVVNASLDFDAVELRPTYRLRKGVPGRSYGLAIARRLGFPATTLERAESFVPREEKTLATLLAEVETRERSLSEALAEAEQARSEALALQRRVQEREDALSAKEKTAERRARQQARDMLLSARGEVEAAIRELRENATQAENQADRERMERAARRRVEDRARIQSRRTKAGSTSHNGAPAQPLQVGDRVRIEATGAEGTILELREERAVVEAGGLRLHVGVGGLAPAAAVSAPRPSQREPLRTTWSGPDFDASSEVDLRGLRADEVLNRLQPALDAAIQAGLSSLRIIHGKGTGALREVVTQLLRDDRRVKSQRVGGVGEGGTGVTIAELS